VVIGQMTEKRRNHADAGRAVGVRVKRCADVVPEDYDLLVIPAGSRTARPRPCDGSSTRRRSLDPFFAASKPVASICHGPWLLVSSDLVRGRGLTSHWHDGVPEEIKAAGGNWVDEPVVVDGDLVTARWPADISAFTPAMMRLIEVDA
jgi:protease I